MTGKTLKELDVKVGDVVRFESPTPDFPEYKKYNGMTATVKENGGVNRFTADDGTRSGGFFPENYHLWSIVSRANPETSDWHITPAGDQPNDAECVSLPDGMVCWRKKEVVEVAMHWSNGNQPTLRQYYFDTHRITFRTVNGEPDCASIKMEKL